MDTRNKIVEAPEAGRIADAGALVVSGYFDPLVADSAERLVQLKPEGRVLLVLIRTPEDAILPARARSELVAGLKAVDYVCHVACGVVPQIQLEDEHRERLAALIGHVHARQQVK